MLKEKLLNKLRESNKKVFTQNDIYAVLGVKSKTEQNAIQKSVDELCADGELIFDRGSKKIQFFDETKFAKGVLSGHERGFAFLDDYFSRGEGLFIASKNLDGALHGDTVMVRKVQYGGKTEGEVVSVLTRGFSQLVGTVDRQGNTIFVLPDEKRFSKDIYIPDGKDNGAANGHKVVVKITGYPTDSSKNPAGEITEILGFLGEKGVDVRSVALQYGISDEFSPATVKETAKIQQAVLPEEIKGRTDFRKDIVFTIDGEDTKDFDDAVSIVKNKNGTYKLGVHIADVGHYVKKNSAIDKDAYSRATSVYFPDAVYPMLPVQLSNGICSLNPKADRLTLSCVMDIDDTGKVVRSNICESVICSCERLTYGGVSKLLDGDAELKKRYAAVEPQLVLMKELADILTEKRRNRGSLDFDGREVKFKFDKQGAVTDIVPAERTTAHRIIEEFMVLANETVAEFAESDRLPFAYRVHEKPTEQKMQDLNFFLRGLGLSVGGDADNVKPSQMQKVLSLADGKPYKHIVSDVMLRSMQKAKYHPANLGHFGLASTCYCHFTSPIRRYPDLIVHRVLKEKLSGGFDGSGKQREAFQAFVEKACQHCTDKEISAERAERDVDDMKKAEYASNFVGEAFDGVISGVTNFGIFVELANTLEGLIHIDYLPDDRYEYDEKKFTLTGKKNKYCLGQSLRVIIAKADAQTKRIDFALEGMPTDRPEKISPPKSAPKKNKGAPKSDSKPDAKPQHKKSSKPNYRKKGK